MGVLKVYHGTDWRKIGCGGTPAAIATGNLLTTNQADLETGTTTGYVVVQNASLSVDTTDVYAGTYSLLVNASAVAIIGTTDGTSGFPVVPGTEYEFTFAATTRFTGVALVPSIRWFDAAGAVLSTQAGVSITVSSGWVYVLYTAAATVAEGFVAPPGAAFGQLRWQLNNSTFYYFDAVDVRAIGTVGTTGRLKLWDGTQWVREACDDDTGGHPLKLWDGTSWVTVACMVPV